MMRILPVLVLAALLSGCFGGRVVPQNYYYHLADITGNVPHLNRPFGVIAVSPLRSDALHQERMILYSLRSSPLMLNTYYYHQWTSSPSRLIQENLITYLRDADFASAVIRDGERTHIDGQIEGYIYHFERVVGNGKSSVSVRLELSFIPRSDKSPGRFAFTRVYNADQQASDNSMEATIVAFSAALQNIYARFVADVVHAET